MSTATIELNPATVNDIKAAIICGDAIDADAIEAAGLLPGDIDAGRDLFARRQAAAADLERLQREATDARRVEDEVSRDVGDDVIPDGCTIRRLAELLGLVASPGGVSKEKMLANRRRLDCERALHEADKFLRATADQAVHDAAGRASNAYKFAIDELGALRGQDPRLTGEGRFADLAWKTRHASKRLETIEAVLQRAGSGDADALFEQRHPRGGESARDIAQRLRGELSDLKRDRDKAAQRIEELEQQLPDLEATHKAAEVAFRKPGHFAFPVQ